MRRLPAEWEKHQATLLSFPHEGADWPGKYGAIQWVFAEIIRKVSVFEPLLLIVRSETHGRKVKQLLEKAHCDTSAIRYIVQNTNRNWMRDSGPVVVKQSENLSREALHFRFTGWAKYGNHRLDNNIPQIIADHLNIPLTKVMHRDRHVVLEGGAINVNGSGTLITTSECLLDQKIQVRNPGFSKADYELIFKSYLGISNTIWLGDGIEGDDTHGHVDDICRFVNQKTVLACFEKDGKDPNHRKLSKNMEILTGAKLEDGSKLTIVPIPMPDRLDFDAMRLPASYVNFMITNGCVLVPTFNDKNDYQALGIIREIFPERKVIGIHAVDLIWGLGTLHCLSHEICD
jgi:agmatine deiminase